MAHSTEIVVAGGGVVNRRCRTYWGYDVYLVAFRGSIGLSSPSSTSSAAAVPRGHRGHEERQAQYCGCASVIQHVRR